MGVVRGRLTPQGAVVEITIMASPQRVKLLKANGLPYPSPVTIPVLVDTGASDCSIDVNVLIGLGLSPRGQAPVHTPASDDDVMMDEYDASLTLTSQQGSSKTFVVSVVGGNFGGRGFLGLLGWTVLAHCLLGFDGPSGTFFIDYGK
jgi:hypothetical protein